MEGSRITCPICCVELEDFRLYTRLFRADPTDVLLVRIKEIARVGEKIMDRSSRRRGSGSAYSVLMRSLLLPQFSRIRPRTTTAATPRLLDLVARARTTSSSAWHQKLYKHVPDAAAQFADLGACWDGNRVGPPQKLDRQVGRRRCAATPGGPAALPRGPFGLGSRRAASYRSLYSGNCGNIRNLWPKGPGSKRQQLCERALFQSFSAARHR